MAQRFISFTRLTYGMRDDGTLWLATMIEKYLIPDYDLVFCKREELQMRYPWRVIAMATYIKMHVRKSGDYQLDLKTKEISTKPVMP